MNKSKLELAVIMAIIAAMTTLALSLMFHAQIVALFGVLFMTVQAISFIIVIGGVVSLISFSSDRVIALLMRVEQLRQSRATTEQMRAQALVIQSQAAMNHATALAASTVVKEVTHSKALYVLHGGEARYIPALAAPEPMPQLAAPAEFAPRTFKLLKVFSQMLQVYALIGGQQVGKTFQARHIVASWQRRGVETWFIGPKWDKNEWANCRMFGGKNDYGAVNAGLIELRNEASRRHSHATLGNKEHAPLLVVLDDWTPVVGECDEAATFILEATTLFASVNIILLFLIHSDTADAWGVGRKGAALKDNFIKVFLIPTRDEEGEVIRELTRAEVKFPGDPILYPVQLESQPVQWPQLDNGGQTDGQTQTVTKDPMDKAPWMNEELADNDRVYLYLSAAKADGADIMGEGFGWRKVKVTLGLVGGSDAVAKMVSDAKAEILGVKQS